MDVKRIERSVKKVFDIYELYFLKERQRTLECRDRKLSGAAIKEESGVALRAVKNGRMVFSYAFDGKDTADVLLDNAEAALPFMDEDKKGGFPGPFSTYPRHTIFDEEGLSVDREHKEAILLDMERAMLEFDTRIVTTRNCEFHEAEVEASIVNSTGLRAEGRKTVFTLSAMCVARQNDEASWYDWAWSHALSELNGKRLGEDIARKAVSFLSSSQIETGIYDGILSPQASCDLLGILEDSFLAENLYKRKTFLADKIGNRCFSESLNITDSGIVGIGSFPFDGEGVPARENRIVTSGVFRSFLFDEYYGRKYGAPSTGNAVRTGIKEPPSCGSRGLFIETGKGGIDEKNFEGIILEELMGTHTANPITGDFSLGAAGRLVKGGSRTPFTGVILSGNLFELFGDVTAVGTDLKFYGSIGSPSLYVENLRISGT